MDYAIINAKILNGHIDMEPVTGKAVIVESGFIKDIIDENDVPSDFKAFNMSGCYLLPGLTNLSATYPAQKSSYKKEKALAKLLLGKKYNDSLVESLAMQEMLTGVTTIRTTASTNEATVTLRNTLDNSIYKGPRILLSDCTIDPDEISDIEKISDYLAENNYKGIRLIIKESSSPEKIRSICNKAHEMNCKVAAVAESSKALDSALSNCVDTVESDVELKAEAIEMMKKNGIAYVTSFSPSFIASNIDQSFTKLSANEIQNNKEKLEIIKKNTLLCIENGIDVGIGSDTNDKLVANYNFWRELSYFENSCKIPASFALHTATEVNAKIAGVGDITGTIDVGKSADMIIVRYNPLENISAIKEPFFVILGGEVNSRPKIKKDKYLEYALNTIAV